MFRWNRRQWIAVWFVGYLALMTAVIGAMLWQRQQVLATMSTSTALEEWKTWREDVIAQQSKPGPVERRVPKSSEPPALVLMRDYFTVSLLGATLFTSLLYWIAAWLITGALSTAASANNK